MSSLIRWFFGLFKGAISRELRDLVGDATRLQVESLSDVVMVTHSGMFFE